MLLKVVGMPKQLRRGGGGCLLLVDRGCQFVCRHQPLLSAQLIMSGQSSRTIAGGQPSRQKNSCFFSQCLTVDLSHLVATPYGPAGMPPPRLPGRAAGASRQRPAQPQPPTDATVLHGAAHANKNPLCRVIHDCVPPPSRLHSSNTRRDSLNRWRYGHRILPPGVIWSG